MIQLRGFHGANELTSTRHFRCPWGVFHLANHFIVFVVETFFERLRQQQIIDRSQAINLWPNRCVCHQFAHLKRHQKFYWRWFTTIANSWLLLTSSMVIVACGLLSLLYWTTPAKLLAKFSNRLAISRALSTEFSTGSHNLVKRISWVECVEIDFRFEKQSTYWNFLLRLNCPIRCLSRISTCSNDFTTAATHSSE